MSKPRLLFMGTPEFAVPSLRRLIEAAYPIVGVVTQPDKPRGRGRRLQPPPTKELAAAHELLILQPERVRDESFLQLFRGLNPDLVTVAAFGQILPPEILERPPLGCINVHPSLLPRFRGAAPLNWTLIRGETTTGVTIMMMDAGVDTGDILMQRETPVAPGETHDLLHDRLASLGAELLLETVDLLAAGRAIRTPQRHEEATWAPRLKKEDGRIDWRQDVGSIVNLIRGLSSTPGAYTFLGDKMLKIYRAAGMRGDVGAAPGAVGAAIEEGLPVAAGDGWVCLQEVQLEGRNRMAIRDFLRGCRLPAGSRCG
ncbi:MAG: methionyl-tRNA formyltransferase [Pseudomonadota bacterium]|nr:methionyl-tRNA formyltransferase [Pseudomonadota bacterium]